MLSCEARRINLKAEACLRVFPVFCPSATPRQEQSRKLWASLNETDWCVKLFCSLCGECEGVCGETAATLATNTHTVDKIG